MIRKILPLIIIAVFIVGGCSNPSPSVSDQTIKATASSGAYITNTGSDTIVNLALAWAEKYQSLHPNISISVSGGGSGVGIASLINRTVDIANASRQIKTEELDQAKKNGVDPKEFVVARDAIAVIVNPENPVSQLTMQQVSDIYSGKINNWSEIGGENRPIVRLSRETNSGTHVYFLENVLRMGKKDDKTFFAQDTLLLPSSQGIVSEVLDNPNAIGYDGLGYITPDLKVIAIAKTNQEPYILPSIESVNAGSYPIARDLYMYTAGDPKGAIKEYLDWIMSPDGAEIVSELGFVPISR
jgi:phosphate transport system substrate-binding protein